MLIPTFRVATTFAAVAEFEDRAVHRFQRITWLALGAAPAALSEACDKQGQWGGSYLYPSIPCDFFYARFARGLPINTGWNTTMPISRQMGDSACSRPMLEVPGWCDSHRLTTAVQVVAALNNTACVRLDCSSPFRPLPPALT